MVAHEASNGGVELRIIEPVHRVFRSLRKVKILDLLDVENSPPFASGTSIRR
jgi:hypothetical protein